MGTDLECECFLIGGPFIGADPDCPRHGTDAVAERELVDRLREAKEARIAELEAEVRELRARLEDKR